MLSEIAIGFNAVLLLTALLAPERTKKGTG